MKKESETLIALTPKSFSRLKYQLVFCYVGGEKYLRSVNLMKDRKTIRKMYLQSLILCGQETDFDDLVADVMISNMSEIGKNSTYNKKESDKGTGKPDDEARRNAANDLLNILKFS